VCEQLAQSGYLAVPRLGVEPATSGLRVRHATVTPPSHALYLVPDVLVLEYQQAALPSSSPRRR